METKRKIPPTQTATGEKTAIRLNLEWQPSPEWKKLGDIWSRIPFNGDKKRRRVSPGPRDLRYLVVPQSILAQISFETPKEDVDELFFGGDGRTRRANGVPMVPSQHPPFVRTGDVAAR